MRVELDELEVPIRGARALSVLALLVARVGDVVGADALIEATWAQNRPARAGQALETVVWRLRSVLEPTREARAGGTVVRTEAQGYRLAVPIENVDSRRFGAAARTASTRLAGGDAKEALAVSTAGLALWRGEPFQAVPDAEWLQPVRQQLSSLRLELAESRVRALLGVGQPERAVGELVSLLADHPFHEGLWALQMLGYYQSGRQAEALDTFATARRVLLDELGVEPGPALRTMHEQILAQAEELDAPTRRPAITMTAASDTVPPRRRTRLIGREPDVAELDTLTRRYRLVTLTGPGGAGKTRLAVEVAHHVADRFDVGVHFVDLTRVTARAQEAQESAIIDQLATVLGLSPRPGATPRGLLLDKLANRAAFLVLDNCEHLVEAAAAVADVLLERCPKVVLLATSREPLMLPDECGYDVSPLSDDASVELFAERLSNLRPDLDPQGADRTMVAQICGAVGGLPLGIELAAAQARVFELHEISASLDSGAAGRFDRGGRGPARHASMLDTVDWSYQLARPDEQTLHRRLSCLPGPATLDAARALCAVQPLHADQTLELLSALVHQALLVSVRPDAPGRPTLFRQLAPTRRHAAGLLPPEERAAVETARDRWVLDRVRAAALDGSAGQAAASAWLDDNETAVHAALTSILITQHDPVALELIARLTLYWFERGRMVEARKWFHASDELARAGRWSKSDTSIAETLAGVAAGLIQDRESAARLITAQLPRLVDQSARHLPTTAEVLVLVATATWVCRLSELGLAAAKAAVDLGKRLAAPNVLIRGRALAAMHRLRRGDVAVARPELEAVWADPQDNEFAAFVAAYGCSRAARDDGDAAAALTWLRRLAHSHRNLAMHPTSELLEDVARVLTMTGAPAEAIRCLSAASTLHAHQGLQWPRQPESETLLDQLRGSVSAVEHERLWASGERLGRDDPTRLLDQWL